MKFFFSLYFLLSDIKSTEGITHIYPPIRTSTVWHRDIYGLDTLLAPWGSGQNIGLGRRERIRSTVSQKLILGDAHIKLVFLQNFTTMKLTLTVFTSSTLVYT